MVQTLVSGTQYTTIVIHFLLSKAQLFSTNTLIRTVINEVPADPKSLISAQDPVQVLPTVRHPSPEGLSREHCTPRGLVAFALLFPQIL